MGIVVRHICRRQFPVKSLAVHKEGCAAIDWHRENFHGSNLNSETLARCDCGVVEADGKAAAFWIKEVIEKLDDYTGALEDFTV